MVAARHSEDFRMELLTKGQSLPSRDPDQARPGKASRQGTARHIAQRSRNRRQGSARAS